MPDPPTVTLPPTVKEVDVNGCVTATDLKILHWVVQAATADVLVIVTSRPTAKFTVFPVPEIPPEIISNLESAFRSRNYSKANRGLWKRNRFGYH